VPDIAFINGHFLPWQEATISIDDRGFQFGDGVYEVIRTYKGQPFQLDAHLERLSRSLREIKLSAPYPFSVWTKWIQEGLEKADYLDAKIYIQITRGVAPRDHAFPSASHSTAVMTIRELHAVSAEHRRSGVTAQTYDDLRWGRCDIKSVNLLANVLARESARQAGVFEAILVREGMVTEGSVSNVMAVQHGVIVTAPEGPRILSGVTRSVVLSLARKAGIRVDERFIPVDALYAADEVFLTGTTVEILSIVQVDGRRIGSGCPGPVTKDLCTQWAAMLR
jgi:D-alanine transaminase